MGKNDKLFFPIQQGWDTNKVVAIIDGKAYRTLGSYSVWGTSGGRPDITKHIDPISKGAILFDSDNAALPSRIEVIEPAHLDTLIESEKAALVALVSYCNKLLHLTTPEEDVDMLIRGERESAPSPERDADPNPYSAELLNLKQERTPTKRQEMQDLELEEVLNKELTGMTVEDRVIELRLALEDDQVWRKEEREEERELREKEIADLLCYICELQKEYREGHGEVMGALAIQVNDIREALSLLNRHMANQIKSLSKQVAELTTQSIAPPPPPPPPPLQPSVVQPMSEPFFTSPTGEIRYMTPGTAEEAATLARFESAAGAEGAAVLNRTVILDSTSPTQSTSLSPQQQSVATTTPFGGATHNITVIPDSTSLTQCTLPYVGEVTLVKAELEIGISEKPSRDSYMEGNSPICNLGASGAPLKCSRYGDSSTPSTEATISKLEPIGEASRGANKTSSEYIRDLDSHMSNSVAACDQGLRKPLTQEETKAEIRRYEAETEAMVWRADANPLIEGKKEVKEDIVEAEVITAMEKKEKEEQTSAQGDRGSPTGANATPQCICMAIGARQATPGQQRSGAGTGANATPIIPGKAPRPGILEETNSAGAHLAEGKPGKVLFTGCPIIPARGDEWKRSFLAGFNAKRERLAPETPICATHVSFALSYPSERVVTIHHPPNTKHEEIIRAVARVQREMYNNYIQHPNKSLVSILQETTELVAPGLQGPRGEKAWDTAESICRDLKLTRATRPPKWLVKGKGDEYEGKRCSLRFSVITASLRAIKSPLPIPYNKGKIYLYQRWDDKAFYVDELKYMVVEPRPSYFPEPVQTWGTCTYCYRVNYTEDTCWSRKNAQAWANYNKYQEAAIARNRKGNTT
ncbi:hypothetical protein L211DRAFT_851056 [Terfezia boudieri ATCC MYA-4762]|uniref:Uncharacterized protein n=1 Tax=Terfezia boudieri ATCC MYA-4762 TaxID=1051890 RepID=A0A3N4LG10_9PEZI|nr:hypothetical protein L211DRAFT_851056 [Terfezia boudieri ATCC MYA-4762]